MTKRAPLFLASLLVLLSASWVAAQPAVHPRAVYAEVLRVIDGDTISVRIGDQTETVRYIGINTPETHHPTRGREPVAPHTRRAPRR